MSIPRMIAFFFGVVGFVLSLLVTISVRLAKSIYLLHINSNGSGTAVTARIGVFGACVYGDASNLIDPTSTGDGFCTHAAVGYTLAPTVFGVDVPLHASSIVDEGLTKALVLNAIACGVAGFGLLLVMAMLCCNIKNAESYLLNPSSQRGLVMALGLNPSTRTLMRRLTGPQALRYALGISHLITIFAFWLDLIVILLARQRVGDYTDGEVSGHMYR
ncbi:hypothetical protein JCM24511_00166 [Saitozyma sp. JCM 24511]|nr:hypothetical protein JCM24511_00166 [Saitozyma sp. JCM 24511]